MRSEKEKKGGHTQPSVHVYNVRRGCVYVEYRVVMITELIYTLSFDVC